MGDGGLILSADSLIVSIRQTEERSHPLIEKSEVEKLDAYDFSWNFPVIREIWHLMFLHDIVGIRIFGSFPSFSVGHALSFLRSKALLSGK